MKFCCKRTCNLDNPFFRIPMMIIGIILIVVFCYFAIIGYGCLWSQYVWNNVFGHKTSCTPFTPMSFFVEYIFTGIGAILTTLSVLGIIAGVLIGLGYGFYRICILAMECFGCCKKNYEDAQVEAKAYKTTEKAPLLQVNIDPK